ncbi:MAG TPA: hypothetical protein VL172_00515 [Kofleriaceae bacterium]|nr:hypothetical protein [Kofleriaceae bacterium]
MATAALALAGAAAAAGADPAPAPSFAVTALRPALTRAQPCPSDLHVVASAPNRVSCGSGVLGEPTFELTFYEGGELRSAVARLDGQAEGLWATWSESGGLLNSGNYRAGRKVGAWVEHDEDHALTLGGSYQDGERTGTWAARGPAGRFEIDYPAGQPTDARRMRFYGWWTGAADAAALALVIYGHHSGSRALELGGAAAFVAMPVAIHWAARGYDGQRAAGAVAAARVSGALVGFLVEGAIIGVYDIGVYLSDDRCHDYGPGTCPYSAGDRDYGDWNWPAYALCAGLAAAAFDVGVSYRGDRIPVAQVFRTTYALPMPVDHGGGLAWGGAF